MWAAPFALAVGLGSSSTTIAGATIRAMWTHLTGDRTYAELDELRLVEIQAGDVLLTSDGGLASGIRGPGQYGHASIVIDTYVHMTVTLPPSINILRDNPPPTINFYDALEVLSSDDRGLYTASNVDPAVGGRTWDVFRWRNLDTSRLLSFVEELDLRGGGGQYIDGDGANVCSSITARAVEAAGGPPFSRSNGQVVSPGELARKLGPPIGRIRIPLILTAGQ